MNKAPYPFVLAAALSACTVGPDYVKPKPAVPAQWHEAETTAGTASQQAYSIWWTYFDDAALDNLIKEAVRVNLDVKLAAERLREARTQRVLAAAAGLPSLDARTNVNRRLNASSFTQSGGSSTATGGGFGFGQQIINIFQMGFDAQWELDLFGGIRRSVEAADAAIEAEQENSRDVLTSLCAEVARNYIDLRSNQQLFTVAERHVRAQQETLALNRSRQKAGLASDLEVAEAAAQLAFTEAQLPAYDTAQKQAVHALSILLDREPGALSNRFALNASVPSAKNPPPADLPSELLRRRPDIRRAERQMAAASAQIGVATAELYPKLNLAGFIGLQNLAITDFTPIGKSWSTASTLTMPLFNWGKLQANIEAKKAVYRQMFLNYRKTVLGAFKEVEDALAGYANERKRRQALADNVKASRLAVELANERYLKGLSDFLDVLTAESALYEAETGYVESQAQTSNQLVALYKALGGGWKHTDISKN